MHLNNAHLLVIEKLKEIAAKNDIPYTSLMNDILRKVVIDDDIAS